MARGENTLHCTITGSLSTLNQPILFNHSQDNQDSTVVCATVCSHNFFRPSSVEKYFVFPRSSPFDPFRKNPRSPSSKACNIYSAQTSGVTENGYSNPFTTVLTGRRTGCLKKEVIKGVRTMPGNMCVKARSGCWIENSYESHQCAKEIVQAFPRNKPLT